MDGYRAWECAEHGLNPGVYFPEDAPEPRVCARCGRELAEVEIVRADLHQGAVSALEQIAAYGDRPADWVTSNAHNVVMEMIELAREAGGR